MQLQALEQILADWRGPAAILLNPEWGPDIAEESFDITLSSPQHVAFTRSFESVYCFFPIAIKAFVVTAQEGAVFKYNGGPGSKGGGAGAGGKAAWRILVRNKNEWEAVGLMQRRPSSSKIFFNRKNS